MGKIVWAVGGKKARLGDDPRARARAHSHSHTCVLGPTDARKSITSTLGRGGAKPGDGDARARQRVRQRVDRALRRIMLHRHFAAFFQAAQTTAIAEKGEAATAETPAASCCEDRRGGYERWLRYQ